MLDEKKWLWYCEDIEAKAFPKLFRFIKELLNEVHTIHKEMFHFACKLEDEGECENDNPEY